jgi:hypothetical protein
MTMSHPYRTIPFDPTSAPHECTHRCLSCTAKGVLGPVSLWRVLWVAATVAIFSLNVTSAVVTLHSMRLTQKLVAAEATLTEAGHARQERPPSPPMPPLVSQPAAPALPTVADVRFPTWHFDSPHSALRGVLEVAPGEFILDREIVDDVLEQSAERTRTIPEQQEGKTVGLRVFGIRSSTMLARLGFANGDRVEAINGWDLGSPEQALEAYARLRNSDEVVVALTRNGSRLFLRYHLR